MLGEIRKLLRFSQYGIGFMLVAAAGALLAFPVLSWQLAFLLAFVVLSSAFAFAINDIADADLDALDPHTRNPVSKGFLSRNAAIGVSMALLLGSLGTLYFIGARSMVIGLAVLVLFYTYSFGIAAKRRPVLDVLYHGAGPALFLLMGWSIYRPLEFLAMAAAAMVFLASAVAEILQELRDYDTDSRSIRNTAVLLGRKRSLILATCMGLAGIAVYVLLACLEYIPYQMLYLTPLGIFLLLPLFYSFSRPAYLKRAIKEMNVAGVAVGLFLLAAYLFLVV